MVLFFFGEIEGISSGTNPVSFQESTCRSLKAGRVSYKEISGEASAYNVAATSLLKKASL